MQHRQDSFLKAILRLKELGAIIGIIVFFLIFSFLSDKFLTVDSLATIFTVAAELGIVTIGITLLMIAGEFDLSVGSIFAVVPMIFALLLNKGVNPVVSFLISLLVAVGTGYLNGIITIKTQIPSFITTLGTKMFWRGILLAVTGGFPIMLSKRITWLKFFGGRMTTHFRYSGLWFIVLSIIFFILLERSKFGNWIFATGGNPGAAKALGVPIYNVKLINFILSSVLAGIAGITTFARFKIVDPTLGMEMELEAIAATVIGGTLLTGGYGSILGAFIGAFMIGMVRNGLILAGAPAYWYRAFIGVILIIAAVINAKIRKRVAG